MLVMNLTGFLLALVLAAAEAQVQPDLDHYRQLYKGLVSLQARFLPVPSDVTSLVSKGNDALMLEAERLMAMPVAKAPVSNKPASGASAVRKASAFTSAVADVGAAQMQPDLDHYKRLYKELVSVQARGLPVPSDISTLVSAGGDAHTNDVSRLTAKPARPTAMPAPIVAASDIKNESVPSNVSTLASNDGDAPMLTALPVATASDRNSTTSNALADKKASTAFGADDSETEAATTGSPSAAGEDVALGAAVSLDDSETKAATTDSSSAAETPDVEAALKDAKAAAHKLVVAYASAAKQALPAVHAEAALKQVKSSFGRVVQDVKSDLNDVRSKIQGVTENGMSRMSRVRKALQERFSRLVDSSSPASATSRTAAVDTAAAVATGASTSNASTAAVDTAASTSTSSKVDPKAKASANGTASAAPHAQTQKQPISTKHLPAAAAPEKTHRQLPNSSKVASKAKATADRPTSVRTHANSTMAISASSSSEAAANSSAKVHSSTATKVAVNPSLKDRHSTAPGVAASTSKVSGASASSKTAVISNTKAVVSEAAPAAVNPRTKAVASASSTNASPSPKVAVNSGAKDRHSTSPGVAASTSTVSGALASSKTAVISNAKAVVSEAAPAVNSRAKAVASASSTKASPSPKVAVTKSIVSGASAASKAAVTSSRKAAVSKAVPTAVKARQSTSNATSNHGTVTQTSAANTSAKDAASSAITASENTSTATSAQTSSKKKTGVSTASGASDSSEAATNSSAKAGNLTSGSEATRAVNSTSAARAPTKETSVSNSSGRWAVDVHGSEKKAASTVSPGAAEADSAMGSAVGAGDSKTEAAATGSPSASGEDGALSMPASRPLSAVGKARAATSKLVGNVAKEVRAAMQNVRSTVDDASRSAMQNAKRVRSTVEDASRVAIREVKTSLETAGSKVQDATNQLRGATAPSAADASANGTASAALHAQPQKHSIFTKHVRAAAAPEKTHRQLHAQQHATAMALADRVTLSSDGYMAISATEDHAALERFVLRLLSSEGLRVVSQEPMRAMLPFYSGACHNNTFAALLAELHDAADLSGCIPAWTEYESNYPGKNEVARWAGHGERLPTWRWQLRDFQHLAESAHVDSQWNPFESWFVSLDEAGYNAVIASHRPERVERFVRRLLKSKRLRVLDENAFHAMLRYYDGTCETQSYQVLESELQRGSALPSDGSCGKAWLTA